MGFNRRSHTASSMLHLYDSEDPICLISKVDDGSLNASSESTELALDCLTPWLANCEFSSMYRKKSPALLLETCPSKTSLGLRGLSFDAQWGRTLFTGQQYSFQINFTTDILSEDEFFQPISSPGVYVRLVLCVSCNDRQCPAFPLAHRLSLACSYAWFRMLSLCN
jgi:hypothetical protein